MTQAGRLNQELLSLISSSVGSTVGGSRFWKNWAIKYLVIFKNQGCDRSVATFSFYSKSFAADQWALTLFSFGELGLADLAESR